MRCNAAATVLGIRFVHGYSSGGNKYTSAPLKCDNLCCARTLFELHFSPTNTHERHTTIVYAINIHASQSPSNPAAQSNANTVALARPRANIIQPPKKFTFMFNQKNTRRIEHNYALSKYTALNSNATRTINSASMTTDGKSILPLEIYDFNVYEK